jgi:transposase
MDRGLRAVLIQMIIPRTKSSIQQRMSKVHDIENISYNPKGFPGVRCDYSKTKSISYDVKVGKYNMANINDLLTQLSDEIITAASNGKSVDEIAKELGVDKNWINIIFNNVMGDEAKVLEVIKNDTHFKILTKNDLAEVTGISVSSLNVICANLLKFGKVSYATLWKRELLPSSVADWEGKEEQIVEWCKQGISRDIIGYMIRSNPSAFRKSLTRFSQKYDIPKYIEMETQNRAAGRNSKFVQLVTLMEYHLPDLCKGLSDDSVEIVTNNFKRLKEDLTEPILPADEPSETTESNIDNDFDDSFDDVKETYEQMEFCDEPVVTAEPQEEESLVDDYFNTIHECIKDPIEEITEYHGLVEHQEESKPKRERPSYLRRKDEWTDRELEILKSMTLNGDTPYEISRHPDMHRSLGAIRIRIDKLRANGELPKAVKKEKPKKPKKTKEKKHTYCVWTIKDEDKLIQMHQAGSSVSEIAKSLGRSKTSVGVRIHKLRTEGKLPQGDPELASRFKPAWTEEEIETIKCMIKEGHSIKDILPHLPNKDDRQVRNKIADMRRTGKI